MRWLLIGMFVLACGDDDGVATPDASVDADTFATCEGECAQTALSAEFGAVTETFDLAFFGVEPDGSLRVEIYGGAADECPTMDSPSPERTIVIPALLSPVDETPQDVTATLLDFASTLTDAPLTPASSATATPRAARLEPLESAFVRFDFEASFEGGTIEGPVYATHCGSLDG